MKNRLFNAFLLLAIMGTMFASCKKEYPQPPINSLPIGTVYTIDEILGMDAGTVFDTASVYGIITADEVSGNLYKMAFLQDRATGAAIELKLDATSGVRIGDSIRLYLKDVTFDKYHNLPQLCNFGPDGHIVILANNRPIEPALVTIADIKAGQHMCGLVRLENVSFTQTGTFSEINESGNRYLVDATNPNNDDNFVVRTSNYANFAYDNLPEGQGNLVAIASLYNSTWQLLIRSKNEMEFENWDPTPTPPVVPGELQSLPYYQSFSGGFGTYMSYSVIDDDHVWTYEKSYNVVQMTAHVQDGQIHYYYENEDWLISSPVAITGVTDAKMTMIYLGRYFDNINNDVTVWVSNNYTYGENPTTAQWNQLPATLSESSNWSEFKTIELALTDYIGQTINVAVKYTSTDTKAGTIEMSAIIVEEGTAGDVPTPPTPGEGEGSGTAEDPYNVAAGIGLQSSEPTGWVHGYIVGAVKSGLTSVSSNDDIDWNAPFGTATNVLIADDANCNEISLCIIVNLPNGKPLRTQVNLMDNPDNLGKHLSVNGKLRKYFGQAGLRDSNGTEADFVLEGYVPPTPGVEIFSETFASGQGDFAIQDVVLPEGLEYVWMHDANYTCMKASAYVNQSYAAESWLVSPAIDLTSVTSATLKFDQAVNKAAPAGALFVMVSTDYDGDVETATWTELSLDQWPAGNNWTFISSTTDLTSYAGQTVTIAFKYTSTTSASATWELRNFVVEE